MTHTRKKLRIGLVASAGGHLTQLLKLSQSWQPYDCFYVSTVNIVAPKLQTYGRVYIIGESNRQHPFKCLMILLRCIRIVLHERPDVIISTGAAPACILALVARLFTARIVWIDSIANIERLSLSGRIVRPFADLFLTQWPELAQTRGKVEFVGAII